MRSIISINADPVRFVADMGISRPLIVSSHERSGSHFLINSVALNSLYSNDPHFDFDLMPLGSFLNFHDRNQVKEFLGGLAKHHCASVVKNHFAAEFFLESDGSLMLNGVAKFLYIVRNPIDVMLSYHRFINHFTWHQGPKVKETIDFLKSAPEGQMLRYQSRQVVDILDRWKSHLLGWLKVAKENPQDVLVVAYRDLDQTHEAVTKTILSFLGVDSPEAIVRPGHAEKTVHVPELRTTSLEQREAIRRAIVEKLGDDAVIGSLFPDLYAQAVAA
ncbi:MAG TPA: sulfotransferase domain-containing protein [Methylovirgula sp.]